MLRAAFAIAILAGCVEHGSTPPDDGGSGSEGAAVVVGDVSPPDITLELVVVGLSTVVVVGPLRPRRRDAKSREL